MAMIFKAVGLKPHGRPQSMDHAVAWWGLRRRAERLARA